MFQSEKSRGSIIRLASLIAIMVLCVGCGDSAEMKLQRAGIALRNGKPRDARDLLESVLAEKPNSYHGLLLMANAQRALNKFPESKKTLDKLVETYPDKDEVRQEIILWTFLKMRHLLGLTDFQTDEKLQEQYDEAMALGLEQAKWREDHPPTEPEAAAKRKAEVEYTRARFIDVDIVRVRAKLRKQDTTLQRNLSDDVDPETQSRIIKQRLEREIERKLTTQEDHLRAAIEANPQYYRAGEMFARVLIQRQRWLDFWQLAETVSQTSDIPARFASQLIEGLINIPEGSHSVDERAELGWEIQSAVKKDEQNLPVYLFASAQLHMSTEEWDKAQKLLEQGLKKNPGDDAGRLRLAITLYYQEQYDQAKDLLEKLRKKTPNRPHIETFYGMTLRKLGKPILAKEALRRATDLAPGYELARRNFLELMIDQGHIGEAEIDVDKYYETNPRDPRAISFKMRFDRANGRRDQVAEVLRAAAQINPLTPDHLRVLIDGYLYLREHDKAERIAKQLIEKTPDELGSHLLLARTLFVQKRDDEVKQLLVAVKEKFPEASSVDEMLGQLYLARNSFDQAVEVLQGVVDQSPDNAQARLALAQSLANLSLVEESLEHVNHVLENDPQNIAARQLAAIIYRRIGRPGKANEQLDIIDETKINEKEHPLLLAQLRYRKGDVESAMAICNRAIAGGHPSPRLRVLLADIYEKNGDTGQAEQQLIKLVRNQPNAPTSYTLLHQFYLRNNKIDTGISQFEEFQTLGDMPEAFARLSKAQLLIAGKRPGQALGQLQTFYPVLVRKRLSMALTYADTIAKVHVRQRNLLAALDVYQPMIDADFQAADAEFRRIQLSSLSDEPPMTVEKLDALAATLTPDQRALWGRVIRQYRRLRQYDKAMALLDDWIAQQPEKPNLLKLKAQIYLEMKQPDQAIQAARQAIEMAPDVLSLRMQLALGYQANYDYPNVESTLREAAQIDESTRLVALASLGRLFVQLGLNQQAVLTFDEMERLGRPKDPRVLYAMGQAYNALAQFDQARQRLAAVPNYAPQYPRAQVLLARIEFNQGMFDESRQRLEKLARDGRYAPTAIRELAAQRLRHSEIDNMLRIVNKAVSLESFPEPLKLFWLDLRAQLAMLDEDWRSALDTLERISDMSPENMPVIASRIVLLLKRKLQEEAIALYDATPDLLNAPYGPMLATVLGQTHTATADQQIPPLYQFVQAMVAGNLDQARSAVEQIAPTREVYKEDLLAIIDRPDATSKDVQLAFGHLGLALTILNHTGFSHLAEDLARMVIERYPSITLSYTVLVQSLINQGKSIDPVIQQVRQQAPNSSLGLYLAARGSASQRDYDQAIATLDQLRQRDPGNPHLQYFHVQVYQQADQIDQAIAELEQIHQQEAHFYQILARNDLAYLLAEYHPDRLEEAHAIAKQAFDAAPNMTPLLDTIGWIEHHQGEHETALVHLNRAIIGLNQNPDVHYHLGEIYSALGNQTWARYHLERAAEGPEDNAASNKAKTRLEKLN